jgi:hypothetical protein
MKKIVYTVAIGGLPWFKYTLPTIEAYADRIGAKFWRAVAPTVFPDKPHLANFEKLLFFQPFFGEQFDRICIIDADCLIRNDCPDLFEVVPENEIGMLNELEYSPANKEEFAAKIMRCQKFYGLTPAKPDFTHFGYYNTGVMVIPQSKRSYFLPPVRPFPFPCYDQDVINMRLRMQTPGEFIGFPAMFDLADRLNRMAWPGFVATCPWEDAYIRHYATISDVDRIVAMEKDLTEWRERGLA